MSEPKAEYMVVPEGMLTWTLRTDSLLFARSEAERQARVSMKPVLLLKVAGRVAPVSPVVAWQEPNEL